MTRPNTSELLPLSKYDKIIVSFSGGKDSTATLLDLFERGVRKDQIELWHQRVDGAGPRLMDWPVTESYCRAVADRLGVGIRFQWREGGFEGEMLRAEKPTGPVRFEQADGGTPGLVGGRGPLGTRLKFPQVSADLKVRWCSAYLKIDVARRAFANDASLVSGKYLFVTGERREESAARSKYAEIERHPSSNGGRRVDQWRSVIDWPESKVWEIMCRWRVRPHPAYYLGWGRVSCALCIFGDPDQWASARELMPAQFARVAGYEKEFGVTIQRKRSVGELAAAGESFLPRDPELRALAMNEHYPMDYAIVPETEKWRLPAGAYKRAGGPT
jgi:3'-phosphoadenosine 5'-phosphosulfate sulfotransferase (PAPS reductase)/FAD synthetase